MKQQSGMKIQGFSRVRIRNQDGSLHGESEWKQNQIVNLGVAGYLVYALGSIANSSFLAYAGLGEGTAPGAAATTLESEITGTNAGVNRDALTAASSGSTRLRCTGTFASADSFVTAQESISNIGLFASSAAGTIFAGNDYASSTCDVNQAVEYTYDITFTTS